MKITIKLEDTEDENHDIEAIVAINPNGIGINFKGCGDMLTDDDHGQPVWIENRDGTPYVCIWDDITVNLSSFLPGRAGSGPHHR